MEKLTVTEARNNFMKLPSTTAREKVIAVTRRNQEVMAIMSWDLYEGLLETLEILADPELIKNLKKARRDIESNKTCSVDEARKRLGL